MTSLESDNQLLLNLFYKWSVWADFLIRIDKCHTFAMKKTHSSSMQFLPYLTLGGKRVPPVAIGESFTYLGKLFSFDMDNHQAKEEILNTMEGIIEKTDSLPLHPRSKISIVTLYMYSKLRWWFSCYQLDLFWLKGSCDSLILRYIRKCLNFHPGANVSHLNLPLKRLGLNLLLPSQLYQQCKVTVRRIMRASRDNNIRSLYVETHNSNINPDAIVEESRSEDRLSRESCMNILREKLEIENWDKFMALKKQNIIVKFITEICRPSCIRSWNKVIKSLPKNVFCFLRRALILALPTNKNLKTWNLIPKEFCPLCAGNTHTQHHILNNCSAAANQNRYLWRHNSVLNCIVYYLSSIITNTRRLYADLPGHEGTDNLFTSNKRPDLVFGTVSKIYIIELTVCFETNLISSRDYKISRYAHLKENCIEQNKEVELIFIELSSLGFYTENINDFKNFLKDLNLNPSQILDKCIETCIRCSYYIYNRRLKDWTIPELLLFV